MNFFHLALAAIEMSSLNFRAGGGAVAEQVYINYPKPDSSEDSILNFLAAPAQELLSEVTWPGGICPTLPADPASDQWVLVMGPNDDHYSSEQSIGFNFNLFGAIFDALYINNNGNLSFGNPFSTYTSTGFPVNGYPMVAPFWADVDTSNDRGQVWMKQLVPSRNVYLVAWNAVGYYGGLQDDKRNTFMVMISDGNDLGMGIGSNVCFCYDDMQWTTGTASGGTDGFNGTSATVGANKGDDAAYQGFGRYDSPGFGPKGINLLDGQSFCFSTSTINQPPLAIGVPPGNQIEVECDGSIVDKVVTFSGPEGDQLVLLSVATYGNDTELIIEIDDNKQTASLTLNWMPSTAGSILIEITATDNGLNSTGLDTKTTVEYLDLIYPGSCFPCDEQTPASPSLSPSTRTTASPSISPSSSPSNSPSLSPSSHPSTSPSISPTTSPSISPSSSPSNSPSLSPSSHPSTSPLARLLVPLLLPLQCQLSIQEIPQVLRLRTDPQPHQQLAQQQSLQVLTQVSIQV